MTLTHGGRLATLLLIPVVLLLSGCLKMETDIEISNLDQVSMRMLLAVEDTYASSIQDACADEGTDGVTVTPYNEDGFVGCVMEASGVPASELGSTGQDLSITEVDDEYVFVMGGLGATADLSEVGLEDAGMVSAMFTSFRVAVTFPGEVTSHNGSSTVDGTTVTWTDPTDLVAGEGLKATGKAGIGLSGILLWTVLIGVAAAVVIGVVLLLRARRKPTQPGDAYPPADGQGAAAAQAYPAEQPYVMGTDLATPTWAQQDVPGSGPGEPDPHSGPDFRPPDRAV